MRKIPKKKIKNILFVCYGNTCRSPMAEGLAKKTLGKKVNVESAGLSPSFDSASKEAVVVMEKEYDIDISSHRPRDIKEVSLGKFDFVIALDLLIHTSLLKHFEVESERLILWEINDPFSMGIEVHKKCAENIYEHIQDTFV
jgi:ribose 5-phosphate isomerase B